MKLSVTIISGFLGAGKTTFLMSWISEMKRQAMKPYIIVNEMGPLDVDGSILSKLHSDVPVVTSTQGCLCCNKKTALYHLLRDAIAAQPDRIIIELSGMGDPVEIMDVMQELEFRTQLDVEQVIGVIDASILLSNESLLIQPCLAPLKIADRILLNKMDRVPPEYRNEIEKKIIQNNHVEWHWTQQAKVDANTLQKWLISDRPEKMKIDPNHFGTSKELPSTYTTIQRINSAYLNIPIHPFLTAIKVEGWMKKFALSLSKNNLIRGRIIRAKGYIRLAGEDPYYLYQFANGYHEWQLITTPMTCEPYLVVIGQELNQAELQADFNDHFPAW